MPTQHWFQFPLLDLPIEIQRLIFYHYLGGSYDITLEHERLTMLRSRFSITGIPSYDLLLTCKHFYEHAGPMRRSLFTGSLILHSVFILVPLKRQDRFRWLRENVQCLHFSDSSVHPERWSTYYESFRNLRRLEIDFPLVRKLLSSATSGQGDGGGIKLEDVLEGKEDTLLSTSLDELQMSLLASLSTGRLEVFVTQKYNIPPGLGLASMDAVQKGNVIVKIRLSNRGVEVIDRRLINDDPHLGPVPKRRAELVRANGNVIDQGSHQSLWEWYNAMNH